ncbi:MAG: tRNA 2-thiouridine(34) synthase MnmA [Patescibacteria group bacterium]|nr:tRNA 2-thiouridine(34) synthase MnmA [Patescibacteria group bacterium]
MREKNPKKVAVLMSGGVDSSVSAVLLKKQGYAVTGFFMVLNKTQKTKEAQDSAKKVAQLLGIPFCAIDLSSLFQRKIIDYLVREYKSGRTPNPCIVCNQEIKFGVMLDRALSLGFDYVASGHYVKSAKRKAQSAKLYKLFKAWDKKKDQSYFLYTLTQDKLKHLLFPLGNLTKQEVRAMAREIGLPVYDRKESQDICFLAGEKIQDFLKKKIQVRPGKIMDIETQKVLGEHQGLPFYTLGQRQGIGIGGTGPYYAVKLDFGKNILWVTQKNNSPKLQGKMLKLGKVNWVADRSPKFPFQCRVKIRYSHLPAEATIERFKSNHLSVIMEKPQRAITPGQSAVFYSGKELLGGAIIRG